MRRHILISLLLAAAGATLCSTARAEAKPTPNLAPPNAPKSEFTARPGFTKDPFFPRSTDVVVAVPATAARAYFESSVPEWVVLKGVSLTKDRKLAIINNYTVGEGEVFTLKKSGKAVTLRCVEIKEESAIVSVNGVAKELPLRAN